ncbi:MAG: enoyl-CoA hydratase/isomerase family protein [Planctomycetales bacterium]|nr:enoyl-CoA hydratase/isomerase family protein [Planctomycetales bacterium]
MASAPTIKLSMIEDDIAVLTLDEPDKGANILSRHVLEELAAHLDDLELRSDLAGLIICSGKPGMFIAGADIREFVAAQDEPKEVFVEMSSAGRRLFQRLSQTPFVTVAAIDGICVGGGAELAMWCDRRLMTDNSKSQIGFPEVKIGIYPGWGGTARMPRIIGLSNAAELICGGENVDGKAATALGFATDTVPTADLMPAAVALVRSEKASQSYLVDRQRWAAPLGMNDTELAFLAVTSQAYIQQQTKGQYPAPLAALAVMLQGANLDVNAACDLEANGIADLFGTPINRALINVFFLIDRNKKDTGIEAADVTPRDLKSVGVFGAGIMGGGIAAATARRGYDVALNDLSEEYLQKGLRAVIEEVSYDKSIKGPSINKALDVVPHIDGTTDVADLAGCDLVIEAIVENPDAKKQLYAKIEPLLGDDAILASNTSTIPITRLSQGLARPEKFVGIHFFNPVRKMMLVEVIRGPETTDETVATAVAYVKKLGKYPIVCNDGPGFVVNRLLLPYMNEALELILEGAPIKQIDRAAKSFGMPMGPITLYDVVGLDTAYHAGGIMKEAFPDRVVESPLITAMYEAGRFGQKSGAGFFAYAPGQKSKGKDDPTLAAIVDPLIRKQQAFSDEQIVDRLFLPMVLEATRLIEDGIVRNVRDIDLGLIFGVGFPPFRGGLMFWADHLGAATIMEKLKPYESIGERFRPTELLKKMATNDGKFYD